MWQKTRFKFVREQSTDDFTKCLDVRSFSLAGNKHICAFLFVWFWEKNKHLLKKSGEIKINDNTLTALTLLVAQSNPQDKELMIKLIFNFVMEP